MRLVISSEFIVRSIVAFFLLILFLLLPTTNYQLFTIHAQTTPLPANVSPTSPIFTDLILHNMFHTFSCLSVGSSIIGQPCLTYQVIKDSQGITQSIPVLSQTNLSGGVLGTTTSLIGMLYLNPPIRATDYLSSVGMNLGIVKEAHAQVSGSGDAVLRPILALWQVSRNIAYLIMIIIFVIIGLMVMFRQRINPQTVITAQTALPGLIIGLILITFSYFIAALITDFAFIGTNLVGAYFSAAQNKPPQDLVANISNQNILTVFSRFVGVVSDSDASHAMEIVFNSVPTDVQNFMRFAAGAMAFQYGNQLGHVVPIVGDLAGIVVGLTASIGTAAAAPPILGRVLALVSFVVLIYSMLKLLLRLVNNYLSIIFLIITAPFQFLAASLPGRQGIVTNWILNMLCNVLAFPAVLAVLYFVAYIVNLNQPPFNTSGTVGLISGTTLPLFGGLDTRFINVLLAFGALTALPSIPDIICRTIGRMGQAGQLIGQELSGNVAGGRGYANAQQGTQIGGTMGRQYESFRGRPPGWSPARELETKDFSIFGRTIRRQGPLPGPLGGRRDAP